MLVRQSKSSSRAVVRHASSLAGSSGKPSPTKVETVRRRITKAERSERMDITMQLTPVRTYMGGFSFTHPKDIRISNRSSGGAYSTSRAYEEPSPYAYEPHTVFLLESRYPIRHEVERVGSIEYIVGICRAPDFEAVMKMYNSLEAPDYALTAMDNARWPWTKGKSVQPVKWWDSGKEVETFVSMSMEESLRKMSKDEGSQARLQKDARREMAQTVAVAERVSEENLSDVDASMKRLPGKIPFEVKFEDGTVAHPSGFVPPTAVHKFGDPEHYANSEQSSISDVKSAGHEYHSDSSIQINQWEAVKERTEEEGGLMSQLTDGILSGGVSAATEPKDAKIPTEIHGVHDNAVAQPMQHPSGFVPPTPRMARGETDARTEVVPGEHVDANTELPEPEDRRPTFSSSDSKLAYPPAQDTPDLHARVEESLTRDKKLSVSNKFEESLRDVRKKYAVHIHEEPFWRPLLSFTVSTRPLATTLARLSRGLEQGTPFYAAISDDDRKCKEAFPARMRDIRLDRMRMLGLELSKLLAGARGGLAGIRFTPDDKGRTIEGERSDKPIEWERRVIGVGVGEWCSLAFEIKEFFKKDATEAVQQVFNDPEDQGPFLVYGMDERGRPTEKVEGPWDTLMLQDNVKDDTLRVLNEIRTLQHWLKETQSTAASSKIFVPEYSGADGDYTLQKHIMQVADSSNPSPIMLGGMNVQVSEGHKEVAGLHARKFIYERVEKLYEKNQEAIAKTVSIRHKAVTYPKKSTDKFFEEGVDSEDK